MQKFIWVSLVLMTLTPASASVYNLLSLDGSHLVGTISEPLTISVSAEPDGPLSPPSNDDGYSVVSYALIFEEVGGEESRLPHEDASFTAYQGVNGGGFYVVSGYATVSDPARFAFVEPTFEKGAGSPYGLPSGLFTVNVPDDLYFATSTGVPISPISSSVPEASTWIMLLFGFIGITLVHRSENITRSTHNA